MTEYTQLCSIVRKTRGGIQQICCRQIITEEHATEADTKLRLGVLESGSVH